MLIFFGRDAIQEADQIESVSIEAALEEALLDPVPQVLEEVPPSVYVFAVRPAWVRIQSGGGSVLFEKIMDAGERYEGPLAEVPATLRAGNSGSVYFEVNGEAFGPAGTGGSVAKNVSLGIESLQNTYSVADLEADPALKRFVEVAEASE